MKAKPKFQTCLKKSESKRGGWYLYIEGTNYYDVESDSIIARKKFHQGITVHTPIFKEGVLQRDANGVIKCSNRREYEECMVVERQSRMLQAEAEKFWNATDEQAEIIKSNRRKEIDFIAYMTDVNNKRHKNSPSTYNMWRISRDKLKEFWNRDEPLLLKDVDEKFSARFADFLLALDKRAGGTGDLSASSASRYFNSFKATLRQAFIDGYLPENISGRVKNITFINPYREHLNEDDIRKLKETECGYKDLKNAFLFSCYTGLRISDVAALTWQKIVENDNVVWLHYTAVKTKIEMHQPAVKSVLKFCGERKDENALVFDLPNLKALSRPLHKWMEKAGIKKRITFHCARHTFASYLVNKGVPMERIQLLMGHQKLTTTQIYAKCDDTSLIDAISNFNNI